MKQLRSFIRISSWFRRYQKNFAMIASPLHKLLKKKDQRWKWTPECQAAFKQIKQNLVQAPILAQADFTKPFIIRTDASAFGLGAVWMQGGPSGDLVIQYARRSLSKEEQKYSTTECEFLAIVWGIETFRS